MSKITPAPLAPRLAAEKARLTVLPGETAPAFIRRQHGRGGCNCPTAYSLCKYALYWRAQHGDFSNSGGWGWAGPAAYGWRPAS